MAHRDAGNYSAKHSGSGLNKEIAQAVESKTVGGEITCAEASRIAGELHVPLGDVGVAIDLLEIRITKCQIGLFGYGEKKTGIEPAKTVFPEMEKAVRDALVNGRLPCAASWEIAERYGIPRMTVSSACEALKIKIKPCQLGAF